MLEVDIYNNTLFAALVYDFLWLILSILVLIFCLRIVWRVEKRLDLVFKLFALAFTLVFLRQLLKVLISLEIINWYFWINWLDLLPTVIILLGMVVMDMLITRMNNEK